MTRKVIVGAVLLVLVIGASALLMPSLVALFRWGGFGPRAHRWFDATLRGDSLELLSQSGNPGLVGRTLSFGRGRPDLLQAAVRSLELRTGSRIGDTVLVRFTIDHSECGEGGRKDQLLLSFLDSDIETRVLWMGVDLCRRQ